VPILVKVYGKLRENLNEANLDENLPVSIEINPEEVHFVYEILEKLVINEEELSHIFVNSKYCGIDKEVKNGDRVGLFPNMALLFVEILPQYR
jgi:molybdopterin converting factor small subunit